MEIEIQESGRHVGHRSHEDQPLAVVISKRPTQNIPEETMNSWSAIRFDRLQKS
jgi:hypothetical protein